MVFSLLVSLMGIFSHSLTRTFDSSVKHFMVDLGHFCRTEGRSQAMNTPTTTSPSLNEEKLPHLLVSSRDKQVRYLVPVGSKPAAHHLEPSGMASPTRGAHEHSRG